MACLALDPATGSAQEPKPAAAPPAQTPTAPAAEAAKFDILEYRVLGNTSLPVREVETAVTPFLGPRKSLDDVQKARAALEAAYHQRGFGTVFVDIPEQNVNEGIVRLNVSEGRLAKAESTGARYFSNRQIRAALPEAQVGKVPNFQTLQAQLAEVNSVTADRSVTPILKAGAAPGTVDLNLRVDDHLPFHGSVELNNQYTAETSTLRALASISYDNLFGRYDSASLQYQFAPQKSGEVGVLVANYLAHIAHTQIAFYYLHSSSAVGTFANGVDSSGAATTSSLQVLGRGKAAGARLILPLVNTPVTTQNLSFGLEYKDFLQSINPQGPPDPDNPSSSTGLQTPVNYTNLSLGYGGAWRDGRIQRSVDASANFAIRGLSASDSKFDNKRFLGRSNFFYLRSDFSAGAALPADLTILWRISGQYAVEPIISNEQFSIAGNDGVRGYLEAEELADSGLKTSLQLGSPKLRLFSDHVNSDAYVFYDYGILNLLQPLSSESGSSTLRSWGVGLNITLARHFVGSLTWADPLVNGNVTRSGDSRFLFSVRGTW